eukprot:6469024-Amphidinium_carterae.1
MAGTHSVWAIQFRRPKQISNSLLVALCLSCTSRGPLFTDLCIIAAFGAPPRLLPHLHKS